MEVWTPAYGHETTYSVSNLGRVRNDANRKGTQPGLILKERISSRKTDRPHVLLRDKTKVTKWYVHRLVYFSFHGPIPDDMGIDHTNGNSRDHRLENLEAVSKLENMRRAHQMGLMHTAKGSRQHRARFTEQQVIAIRQRVAHGEKQVDLAVEFGVTSTAINCIVKRLTWKHV